MLTLPVARRYPPPTTDLPIPFEQNDAVSDVAGSVAPRGNSGAAVPVLLPKEEEQDTEVKEEETVKEEPKEKEKEGALVEYVGEPIEVENADPGVILLIHAMQIKMRRTDGTEEQVSKFYSKAVLTHLAKMSTNPIGAEFANEWVRMNSAQAAWYNSLSDEENVAIVKIMRRIVLMEREEIGNCPLLLDRLKNMMRTANLSVREFVRYDVEEISALHSKEFPATELLHNLDRAFWKSIQGASQGTRRPVGFDRIPPDVCSGHFFWKRHREDSEEVKALKDFVMRCKCYNVRNQQKRMRRT